MYLSIFLLLLLSIYKIFFLLECVICAYWGTPWKKIHGVGTVHDPLCHLCAKEPENVLHALDSKVSRGRSIVKKKWSPPVLDSFKTNFNEAMFNESDDAGIGVVILNSAGKVMAALSEKTQEPPSVMWSELLAARRAVQFTIEMGFRLSSFEGDSETVINSLIKGGMENKA